MLIIPNEFLPYVSSEVLRQEWFNIRNHCYSLQPEKSRRFFCSQHLPATHGQVGFVSDVRCALSLKSLKQYTEGSGADGETIPVASTSP